MAEAAGVFGARRPLYTEGKHDSSIAEREAEVKQLEDTMAAPGFYDDPDTAGPRRFDIESINDPDEKKVELQILATERNDGQ